MLKINEPSTERQNVEPLTVEEEQIAISALNTFIASHNTLLNTKADPIIVQRLIHNYENYRHFFEVAGGWDGLAKLQALSATADIKVNYELVKTVPDEN